MNVNGFSLAPQNRTLLSAVLAVALFVFLVGCRASSSTKVQPNSLPNSSNPETTISATANPNDPLTPCQRESGKYGYCIGGENGDIVLPAIYDEAGFFDFDGLATVKINNCWGYIDRAAKVVIPIEFDQASSFNKGLALVKRNGKNIYLNRAGETVIATDYDYAEPFFGELAVVGANGKRGFIASDGRVVIAPKYDQIGPVGDGGLADVMSNGKWGFVNKTGEVVPPKYDNKLYSHLFERPEIKMLPVGLNGKWGFINRDGKEIIALNYDSVVGLEKHLTKVFSQGLAGVQLGGKYGYIDTTGKTVIDFKYDDANPFSVGINISPNNYALVTLNGEKIAVDKNGKEYNFRPNHHQDSVTPRE